MTQWFWTRPYHEDNPWVITRREGGLWYVTGRPLLQPPYEIGPQIFQPARSYKGRLRDSKTKERRAA